KWRQTHSDLFCLIQSHQLSEPDLESYQLMMWLVRLLRHFPNRRFIDCPAASMPITSPDFLQKILGEKHANWLRKGVNK
ncbi:hypothetical protein, partial [Enterobacter hormaechei]|uniref:hypothetical protein n=1 Tax=Enterobacter hormaechei TaxID=158836 RepID=UPI001F4170BC